MAGHHRRGPLHERRQPRQRGSVQDDTVVVLGHTEARTKSGNDLKVPFVHIWRMSGGTIKRGQLLTDTSVIVQALE